MEDCFVVFYDKQVFVILRGFKGTPFPEKKDILDWYAREYMFDRSKLSGGYSYSIDVTDMKYEDFQSPTVPIVFNERKVQHG